MKNFISNVLQNMPADWLNLTTHRLDIYNESLAKTEFIEQFENLYKSENSEASSLTGLPTAFDYIRLGHPLSCVLEWSVAKKSAIPSENVISFSSKVMPILAVLRKNIFERRNTRIFYTDELPNSFDVGLIKKVYGYQFDVQKVASISEITDFDGSSIFIDEQENICTFETSPLIDFHINIHSDLGSIIVVNNKESSSYISEIQHVRRRESIAMTPANCLTALQKSTNIQTTQSTSNLQANKSSVKECIKEITEAPTKALVASSGLSIQYAILMGLIHDAIDNHPNKSIKIVVPPNCYGGTNDQARRIAACLPNVDIVDLPVDGDNDMVQSIEQVLTTIANEDAVPYIIAEIPTNPRVEVPNLVDLSNALGKKRTTTTGEIAVAPVFILDQTFCPNVHFLGDNELLANVKTISFASGSKFPSGGKCTAGYCVGNSKTTDLIAKIELHLNLCDNEATALQYEILAEQIPSMLDRIQGAYANTRDFVNYIEDVLPEAKINFVSETLAELGFTPSVFSLDLPTKGNTDEEREAYKRALNLKLINMMITSIPTESKYCVSYGQLKGCYWTIPATSTQGTTKEGDKDYIARVALSSTMDLALHKKVFLDFVKSL
jgi:cystathionine beta-lyase/cystathionine gamma-synthase